MIKICTSCGAQVPEGSRFCPECGTEIKDLCPKCGAPITGTKFCPECGQKLDIQHDVIDDVNHLEENTATQNPEPIYRTVQQPSKESQTCTDSSTPFEVDPVRTEGAFNTAKVKKPFYKRWWFWLIIGVVLLFAFAGGSGSSTNSTSVTKDPASTTAVSKTDKKVSEANKKEEDEVKETEKEDESANVPTEYKNALRSAQLYADTMYMSKAAIYDQLTSEYGEQFPAEAAQYAIDNLDVDWNANALKTAKNYQETMSMSKAAIYDQLISEYGEKFTAEQAQYAVDHLE